MYRYASSVLKGSSNRFKYVTFVETSYLHTDMCKFE